MDSTKNLSAKNDREDVKQPCVDAVDLLGESKNAYEDTSTGSWISTERQKLEDKMWLIEAMDSGQIPQYEEQVPAHPPDPPTHEQEEFEPCLFFFYGTLMDPVVLMTVAMLKKLPELEDAWVEGFEMEMWNGIYPTLIPDNSACNRISGKVWRATSMNQCMRLQLYETSAYEVCDCLVHLGEGGPVLALTFKWAGDLKADELTDGIFDLVYWQEHHKPLMF